MDSIISEMEWVWGLAVIILVVFYLLYDSTTFIQERLPRTPDAASRSSPQYHHQGYSSPKFRPSEVKTRSGPTFIYTETRKAKSGPLYNFGALANASDRVQIQTGIPELDLHMLKVLEAKKVTGMFLQQSRGHYPCVRIITGRGLHSIEGIPKIKPQVEWLLKESGYKYKEVCSGGGFEVKLPYRRI